MAEQEVAAAARAQGAESAGATLPPQSERVKKNYSLQTCLSNTQQVLQWSEKKLQSANMPQQHTASTVSTVQDARGTTTITDNEIVTET